MPAANPNNQRECVPRRVVALAASIGAGLIVLWIGRSALVMNLTILGYTRDEKTLLELATWSRQALKMDDPGETPRLLVVRAAHAYPSNEPKALALYERALALDRGESQTPLAKQLRSKLQPYVAHEYIDPGNDNMRVGRYAQAEAFFWQAVSRAPFFDLGYVALADAYVWHDVNYPLGVAVAMAGRRNDPDYSDRLDMQLATALVRSGQPAAARKYLDEGLALPSGRSNDYVRWLLMYDSGCLSVKKADRGAAAAYFREALGLTKGDVPTTTVTLDALGMISPPASQSAPPALPQMEQIPWCFR